MRIRTVKPEFWTDSLMVSLPRDARLLFIGLWNASDDHGYIADDHEQLKMLLFPSDLDLDFEDLLELLVACGRVERFELDGDYRTFLRIKNWEEHQRVDHPSKSKILREASRKVAIPLSTRRGVAEKYGCKAGGEKLTQCYYCGESGKIHWHKLRNGKPSSWVTFVNLELDHFIPEVDAGQGVTGNIVLACRNCNRSKGKKNPVDFMDSFRESSRGLAPEWKGTGNGKERNGMDTPISPNQFSTFWTAYPKKVCKPQAEKAFLKAIKKADLSKILESVKSQKDSDNWKKDGGQFIPNPATWLNGERWNDTIEIEKPKTYMEQLRDVNEQVARNLRQNQDNRAPTQPMLCVAPQDAGCCDPDFGDGDNWERMP